MADFHQYLTQAHQLLDTARMLNKVKALFEKNGKVAVYRLLPAALMSL